MMARCPHIEFVNLAALLMLVEAVAVAVAVVHICGRQQGQRLATDNYG